MIKELAPNKGYAVQERHIAEMKYQYCCFINNEQLKPVIKLQPEVDYNIQYLKLIA